MARSVFTARTWTVALLVVLAGCIAPTAGNAPLESSGSAAISGEVVARAGSDDDVIGWEAGYRYDDPIDVNLSDGLSDAEFEAYLARSMARVEYLRNHEFTRPISVEVVTREQLQRKVERTGSFASNTELTTEKVRIMNVFWEALFFVGEDTDVREIRATEQSSFLGAYYLFGSDTFRIVTDDPDRIAIRESLLIHELTHALQDEYAGTPLETRSDDDNYATAALIEGDAMVVEYRYREHCDVGAWECVAPPPRDPTPSGSSTDVHRGFRALRQFAYSDGPVFVHHLYEHGANGKQGWAAVDTAFENRPRTTEEIIHPERYPAETPPTPSAPSSPQEGWTRLGGPYPVGEVEIFAAFWYQGAGYGNHVIDTDSISTPDAGRYDRFDYTSAPSEGWNGDGLEILAKGNETGYIWITNWDTERDAAEFHRAYLDALDGHGARKTGDRTWTVPEGPYEDAFYVSRNGTRVTVVNGPTTADLPAIHPGIRR